MTGPDALSDALVAALAAAAAPSGGQVLDHEALPMKVEELPDGGIYGVFLFQDAPDGEGVTDTEERHPRVATFKVEMRIPKATHLLHGTQGARRLLVQFIKTNPTLGGLARGMRLGPVAILVHETNSAIACAAVDVHVDYTFDPEAA